MGILFTFTDFVKWNSLNPELNYELSRIRTQLHMIHCEKLKEYYDNICLFLRQI